MIKIADVNKANCCMSERGSLGAYRAIEELREFHDLEVNPIQIEYLDLVQLRAVDSGHEVLQILATAFEIEVFESREYRPCD